MAEADGLLRSGPHAAAHQARPSAAQLQKSYQRASTTRGVTPTVEGTLLETMGLLLEIGGKARPAPPSLTQLGPAFVKPPCRICATPTILNFSQELTSKLSQSLIDSVWLIVLSCWCSSEKTLQDFFIMYVRVF